VLGLLPPVKRYLVKRPYLRIPVFGWNCFLAKDVGVDVLSATSRLKAIDACSRNLEQGEIRHNAPTPRTTHTPHAPHSPEPHRPS
jgi:hypothetical protein